MTTRTRKLRRSTGAPSGADRGFVAFDARKHDPASDSLLVGRRDATGCGARLVALALVFGFLVGCGSSGGGTGGGDSSGQPVIETQPVDLPPGVTSALVAWEPSLGDVSSYLVFRSTNDDAYEFSTFVSEPSTTVIGGPGDEVRLVVIAVSASGESSEPSPASAPIRFHAAEPDPAALAAVDAPPAAAPAGVASGAGATADAGMTDTAMTDTAMTDANGPDANGDPSAAGSGADDTATASRAMRSLIAAMQPRLGQSGLSPEADLWLQGAVAERIALGLSLVATGDANADGRIDLVWRDASGQHFVTDGRELEGPREPSETLVESLRLGPTERVRAIADLDGDALAEWIVEDLAAGTRAVISGSTGAPLDATLPPPGDEARFLGVGDLDGDGRSELVTRGADGVLERHAVGRAATPLLERDAPADAPRLLQVADVDGDGRADLIAQGPDDRLVLGLSRASTDGGTEIVWTPGADASCAGLELVASLDLDGDGASGIAWLRSDALEFWSPFAGPRDAPTR
ncbi:MAG: hypothetical protein H6748_10460 [Spirochaetaceae bacterium]|nr:hypothetical protein [Myxococcales bacterium]MCB9724454.1 hypothetical protein [Spirochaetaceae bacterium]